MQARRVLLFIGILMLLALAAGSLVPPPDESVDDTPETDQADDVVDPPSPFRDTEDPVAVEFRAEGGDGPRGEDRRGPDEDADAATGGSNARSPGARREAPSSRQVVVTVRTRDPGEVALDGLGLLQTATPGAPAVFDLFTSDPGIYPVLYTPTGGEQRRIGTLVVEDEPPSGAER